MNWFHLLILVGGPLAILIDCMIIFHNARCYKDVYIANNFLSMTYDLNGFKFNINKHISSLDSL